MRRRRNIHRVAPDPLILSARYRTFATLSADLTVAGDGSIGSLWGPSTWIGHWLNDGGSIRLLSELRLLYADGSEFSVGADGGGADIEYVGAGDPTSWATAGASGGIILDGSAQVKLMCLGSFSGTSALLVSARAWPISVSASNEQFLGVGHINAAGSDGLRGGIRDVLSLDQYGGYSIGSLASPSFGSGVTDRDRTLSAGVEVLCSTAQLVADTATGRGSWWAGGYAGDPNDEISHVASAGSGSANSGDAGLRVVLECREQAGTLTARFERLTMAYLPRAGGAAT